MQIKVNGKFMEFHGGTIKDLLVTLNLHGVRLVVEKNGHIVHNEKIPMEPVKEGDELELVRFVGGG